MFPGDNTTLTDIMVHSTSHKAENFTLGISVCQFEATTYLPVRYTVLLDSSYSESEVEELGKYCLILNIYICRTQ